MIETPETRRLESLQVLRGLAALAVVFHNAGWWLERSSIPPPFEIAALLDLGYLGVDVFFVLSGFVIHHVTVGAPRGPGAAGRFLLRRASRIYPPYWLMAALAAAAILLAPGGEPGDRPWTWAGTVTLVPGVGDTALGVGWTLRNEMLFYAIVAALIAINRFWSGLAALTVALGLALHLRTGPTNFYDPFVTPLHFEFLFGVLVSAWSRWSVAERRRDAIARGVDLVAIGGAVAALALFERGGMLRADSVYVGAAVALLLIPLARAERRSARHAPFRAPRALVRLGDGSYALYLSHDLVCWLVVAQAAAAGLFWPTALAACLALSLVVGAAFHQLIERPLARLGRRLTEQARAN